MQELTVQTKPAILNANFNELRESLSKELKDYDFVVTADTVGDAKKKATEINKLKGQIDTKRKEVVALVSTPIDEFNQEAKSLTEMCTEARQKIIDQVAKFEDETRDLVRRLLDNTVADLYQRKGIRDEFKTATTDDLVKLTAVTSKQKLTKAARETVEARVNECAMKQQRTDLRLSQLENECYRAGLHSPLTREHIEGFLFTDDDQRYQEHLKAVIDRELERQTETERRAREAARQEVEEKTPETDQPEEPKLATEEEEPPAYVATSTLRHANCPKPGNVRVTVRCILEVEVPASMSNESVIDSLRQKLESAGIKDSVQSINAHREKQAA